MNNIAPSRWWLFCFRGLVVFVVLGRVLVVQEKGNAVTMEFVVVVTVLPDSNIIVIIIIIHDIVIDIIVFFDFRQDFGYHTQSDQNWA
jgi:hypothetical protein